MKKGLLVTISLLLSILFISILTLALGNGRAQASFERDAASNDVVELSPGITKTADPGQTISYTHVVTNTAATTHTFEMNVSAPSGWPVDLVTEQWPNGTTHLPFSLGPALTKTFEISLTVPSMIPSGDFETVITVTGVSTDALAVATDTTNVNQIAGVKLSPAEDQSGLNPGEVVTYAHTITNTGEITDIFDLEATSSQGWTVELFRGNWPTGTQGTLRFEQLAPGATDTLTVGITVPSTAAAGSVDRTIITATSNFDSNAQDTVTDTTTLMSYIYLPLVLRNYPPSWQQSEGTNDVKVYDVSICPSDSDIQYAGTTSGLYHSADGGSSWQLWTLEGRTTPVVVNPNNCGQAFAANWGEGIYRVGQDQQELISQRDELKYIYGLAITENGQTLYAGTNGDGLYKANTEGDVSWNQIGGISSSRIRSTYIISDTLYVGARKCTYYQSNDEGSSWQVKTVLPGGEGTPCNDAQVWAISEVNNTIYAGLDDHGLYQSQDDGTNWKPAIEATTIYRFGLQRRGNSLYAGAHGKGVYTCENGSCQLLPYSGLGSLNLYGITIADIQGESRLLAGSDDGIWWVPLIE